MEFILCGCLIRGKNKDGAPCSKNQSPFFENKLTHDQIADIWLIASTCVYTCCLWFKFHEFHLPPQFDPSSSTMGKRTAAAFGGNVWSNAFLPLVYGSFALQPPPNVALKKKRRSRHTHNKMNRHVSTDDGVSGVQPVSVAESTPPSTASSDVSQEARHNEQKQMARACAFVAATTFTVSKAAVYSMFRRHGFVDSSHTCSHKCFQCSWRAVAFMNSGRRMMIDRLMLVQVHGYRGTFGDDLQEVLGTGHVSGARLCVEILA